MALVLSGDGNSIGGNLYFDANGNIGIGTETPAQSLHINGSTRIENSGNIINYSFDTNSTPLTINSGNANDNDVLKIIRGAGSHKGSGLVIGGANYTNGTNTDAAFVQLDAGSYSGANTAYIHAHDNNGTDFIVLGNGTVGVSTDNPLGKLHVYSTDYPHIKLSGNTSLTGSGTPEIANVGSFGLSISTFKFGVSGGGGVSNGSSFLVNNDENIGINNTTDIKSKLHVVATGSASAHDTTATVGTGTMNGIMVTAGPNESVQTGVWFGTGGNNNTGSHWSGIAGARSNHNSTWGTHLSFYTHGDDLANISQTFERVRITSTGRMGIGTSTPAVPLHVRAPDNETLRLDASDSQQTTIGFAKNNDVKFLIGTDLYANGGHDFFIYDEDTATTRVIVDSNGDVGIGTTNPQTMLHVGATSAASMQVGPIQTRTGAVSISSSETRWYKLLEYSGHMMHGEITLISNRYGGYNQTGAYRRYMLSIGGYSASLYGPITEAGDSGAGGVASLETGASGSNQAVYLRVNSSIYGGTTHIFAQGVISSWAFDGSYVTTAP